MEVDNDSNSGGLRGKLGSQRKANETHPQTEAVSGLRVNDPSRPSSQHSFLPKNPSVTDLDPYTN